MPLPGPPEINSQGWRTTCHIPANSTRGLPGTMTRSDTHVVSFTNRTFCHVLPPSAVRYTPRSAFAAQAWPTAPTNFFFQAEDGIRDLTVTGVQTCALPI